MTTASITKTNLSGIKLFKRGKVRDVYDLGDKLLIIATDRISCFDCILPTAIPDKGKILNQLSLFWFDFTKNIIPNHIISSDIKDYPSNLKKYSNILDKRSVLVKKADMVEIECVVRGYLSGSGWNDYKETGTIKGVKLPKGLKESSKLPEPIFTPSIKAKTGHDENISEKKMREIVGDEISDILKNKSLELYKAAAKYAESKGVIIADTKFEFGRLNDQMILIDEALTPDSSRFWPKSTYKEGGPQKSYDKQYVRDYLLTLDWDKTPPAPPLPDEIVDKTVEKYMEALRLLSGKTTI